MAGAAETPVSQLHRDTRRLEPRWFTVADLAVIVAGVALAMSGPWRAMGGVLYFGPPPLIFLVVVMGLQLAMSCGIVMALVVLFRRLAIRGPGPARRVARAVARVILPD